MLTNIIKQFPRCRLLVIGDLIADEFVYGEIARVSREAPVMILRYERTETMPGGAGNAAANVAALAERAALIGVIGRDVAGRQLTLGLRRRGVTTSGVLTLSGYATPTKTRILAGSVHSTRQQVIRIDREPTLEQPTDFHTRLIAQLNEKIAEADAVIVSDYNYGVVSETLLAALGKASKARAIPVVVDSRFHLRTCHGFTAATPNQAELEALVETRLLNEVDLNTAGLQLRAQLGLSALLLTRGSEGMILFEEGRLPYKIEAVGSKEPVDVTGAGDTVIATFTLALAAGASFQDAARIANYAGGLVVMKRGTATVTREELLASIAQ
ncbi:MAG: bifunctional ADP-heptose synthase [Acidobacteriota bacterium]